jgi:hypothetical protein
MIQKRQTSTRAAVAAALLHGEALQVDRAAAVSPLADLAYTVMRFDREQHAATGDFHDSGVGDDRTSNRSRREMAHIHAIELGADGVFARNDNLVRPVMPARTFSSGSAIAP